MEGKGTRIRILFVYERPPEPRDIKTKHLMAVVATHVFVAVAPPPEGATPAVTNSSPHIGAQRTNIKFVIILVSISSIFVVLNRSCGLGTIY